MEYTVQKFAHMAGVSVRTLRFYDSIGLLKPARVTSSGYRIYGSAEVDRLQQIMLYRECGMDLAEIKKLLDEPGSDRAAKLRAQLVVLLEKRESLDAMIGNIKNTLRAAEGGTHMTDEEKFIGLKKNIIEGNEKKYGKEARSKYGNQAVDKSNRKIMDMTREQYDEAQKLSAEANDALKAAVASGDPAGESAMKACELHKRWLCLYWDEYSKEAHMALARMYVEDERFTAYYEKIAPGTAKFLRDAMEVWTGII